MIGFGVYLMLAALAVLAYQCWQWLQLGYWTPLPLSAWVPVPEMSWKGLQKIVAFLLDTPLSVASFLAGFFVIQLADWRDAAERRRRGVSTR